MNEAGIQLMAKKSRKTPMRRDGVSREQLASERMIRYVVDPQGQLVPDLAKKLPGRGVWLKPLPGRIEAAQKRGVFKRLGKGPVSVASDLSGRVEAMLYERMLETVSLARRAGQLIGGFDLVSEELASGRDGILVIARDAGSERKRLIANSRGRRYISVFDRRDLGRRIGRDELVYAFMADGALARRLVVDARRLAGYRQFEMVLETPLHDGAEMAGKVSLTR